MHEHIKAINGDDMGLGKSAQSLRAMDEGDKERILIVCPNSLKYNWLRQIERWTEGSVVVVGSEWSERKQKYVSIYGADIFERREQQLLSKARFTIINYELIGSMTTWIRDEDGRKVAGAKHLVNARHLPTITKIKWDGIIFDEAHVMRNRKSKAFLAAKSIARDFNGKVAVYPLSGTPLFNRAEDLWPMLHLVDPKRYSSFWKFVEQYCNTYVTRYSPWPQVGSVIDADVLKEDLREHMIRRLKDEVLDLPAKSFVTLPVDLHPKHQLLYDEMEKESFVEIGDQVIEAVNAVALMTRLKQMAISPDLLVEGCQTLTGAKTEAIMDIVAGLGDQKCVIFSQFAQVIKRLYPLVKKAVNGKAVMFTGDNNIADRLEAVNSFQEGDTEIIMTTTTAGGVGLDMYAGSVVIFVDLLWVPALNNQAVARVERIGQTKPMTIYVIVAQGTIEHRILEVLGQKEALFNAVIPVQHINKIARDIARSRHEESS